MTISTIQLASDQQAMLNGEQGQGKQMAMRLLLDMAAAAGAAELIPIESAHLSGVSPLTGVLGLGAATATIRSDSRPTLPSSTKVMRKNVTSEVRGRF